MKTLLILTALWGVVSYFKIDKHCKRRKMPFDPFSASFFNFLGFLIGGIVAVILTVGFIITYLP
jgi:hypothetical protein